MGIAQVLVIIVLVVMILAAIGAVWYSLKRRRIGVGEGRDYRAFYVMGLAFVPLGIVWIIISFTTEMSIVVGLPFLLLGIVYLIVGLTNKDKWRTPGE